MDGPAEYEEGRDPWLEMDRIWEVSLRGFGVKLNPRLNE